MLPGFAGHQIFDSGKSKGEAGNDRDSYSKKIPELPG